MNELLVRQAITDNPTFSVLRENWSEDTHDNYVGLSGKQNWWKLTSNMLALLKQAQDVISTSKKQIEAQNERIKELEKLATTDALTGLNNRRGFIDAFKRELDRVQRGTSQGGLIMMIDLDNFKGINDIYGHQAGDEALKIVAATLQETIRTMDIVSRHGGDEFAILLVNTDRTKMLARTQSMIQALNNLSFTYDGHIIPVRASIGLKEFTENSNPESILDAADQHMYANKKQSKKEALN